MNRFSIANAGSSMFLAFAAAFLVLPTLIVIPMSFSRNDILIFPPSGFSLRWYENFFSASEWRQASLNSVIVAISTMVLATMVGTSAALGLARLNQRLRGPTMLFFLVPIISPAIVTAVAMYKSFALWGLSGTVAGMVIAHSALALPFVVIYVSASLQKMDWRLEQAARSLGASPRRAFFHVTLPAITPGVLVGSFFAFLTSFDEVVVSLFLAGSRAVTLPVQMWNGIRFEINPTVAAVAVVLLLISSSIFIFVSLVRRRFI
jgi:putative spermidine/putrescine transport system permease protein